MVIKPKKVDFFINQAPPNNSRVIKQPLPMENDTAIEKSENKISESFFEAHDQKSHVDGGFAGVF